MTNTKASVEDTHPKSDGDQHIAVSKAGISVVREYRLFISDDDLDCKTANKLLQQAGIEHKTINLTQKPFMSVIYDITSAPTLVLTFAGITEHFVGLNRIQQYVDQLKTNDKQKAVPEKSR